MPKSLAGWLHYQALQWQMPGRAVKSNHGGQWHKIDGPTDSWVLCGAWVGGSFRSNRVVGWDEEHDSPWSGGGHTMTTRLCPSCFGDELPLLRLLEDVLKEEREEDE